MFDRTVRSYAVGMLVALQWGGALVACSSDPEPVADAGEVVEDARPSTTIDSGMGFPDALEVTDSGDAGTVPDPDSGTMTNPDATPMVMDAGVPTLSDIFPGSHVTIGGAGRVAIGDTFAEVTAALGRGTRSMGTAQRSYEWALAGGVELTVWFTNTNLDDNDDPPADVDGTDEVLWIAVGGTFTGRTPSNIGLGSTRAAVETAYGASPRTTVLTMPMPGELTSYYTRGFLAAFGQDGLLRTFTVTKTYPRAPDAQIDIAGGRLVFGGSSIRMNILTGSSPDDIRGLLGPPDSQGGVPGQSDFGILNYAFIGMEFIILDASDKAASAIIHAPFYGTTGNMTPGLGSPRAEFETYATQTLRTTSGPTASRNTMGLFCFGLPAGGGARTFGVTYSAAMPQTVTSIILGQCQ